MTGVGQPAIQNFSQTHLSTPYLAAINIKTFKKEQATLFGTVTDPDTPHTSYMRSRKDSPHASEEKSAIVGDTPAAPTENTYGVYKPEPQAARTMIDVNNLMLLQQQVTQAHV